MADVVVGGGSFLCTRPGRVGCAQQRVDSNSLLIGGCICGGSVIDWLLLALREIGVEPGLLMAWEVRP
jgi:hypothetical protein